MTNGQWRNRIVSNGVAEPDQLLANPSNWRIHPRNQQDALTGVLDEVGYVQDVIVNLRTSEDWPISERGVETLVDGHLRVALAMRHNEQQIPVKYVDLSPHEEALILATLDPISALAAPDAAKLDAVLREVKTGSEYVQTLLDDLAHDAGLNYGGAGDADAEPQIDRAEELNKKWQVKPGDLWCIGEHRLLCGDSTKREDVERVMEGRIADLNFSDPPYGVERDGGFEGFEGFGGFGPPIARRQYTEEWDSERPSKAQFNLMLSCAINSIFWGGNFFADLLPQSTHWIVWDKNNTMPTFGDCELAWTSFDRKSVKKFAITYNGLIGKEKERFHPTQKPLMLYTACLPEYTKKGDMVIDFYAGSGTTLLACQNTGRIGRALEQIDKFCAVILERMATSFPGIEIERVGSV